MRLAIVNTSTGWGGLEMNVIKLAKELQNNGVEVYMVCQQGTQFEKQASESFPSILKLNNVKKYFDFKNARVVSRFFNEQQIQVVFTAYRPDLDLLLWVKRKTKSIKIIHQQQMQIGIPKKGYFQRLRFKAVDLWLTPLEWLKSEVIEKTTLDSNKIRIVPLGVNKSLFENMTISRTEAQQFFQFQTDAFVLGVIGRIDPKKGQLFLSKAIKCLIDMGEDVVLLIVGAPTIDDENGQKYYESILKYIAENGLQDRILFAPFTKQVNNFYQAIDLFVMSSEGETFGMVTVEALFSKKPVIGTNSSGTPEVLGHGTRGKLYEFDNLDSFIEAYFEVRKSLELGKLNGDLIQQEAMNLYSLDLEVKGVLDAINELKLKSHR